MNTDNLTKNFSCEECTMVFDKKLFLKKHIRSFHGPEFKHQCDKCSKRFNHTHSLTRHKRTFHDKVRKVSCNQCGKVFGEAYTLKRHVKLTHDNIKDFKCDPCGMAYGLSYQLNQHYRRKHKNIKVHSGLTKEPADSDVEDIDQKGTVIENFEAIKSQNQLSESIQMNKGLIQEDLSHEEDEPNLDLEKQESQTEVESKNDENWDTSALATNGNTNNFSTRFSCNECEMKFEVRLHLKRHYLNIHGKVLEFQCDKCMKTFNYLWKLKIHIKSIHEDGLKCLECNEGFSNSYRLNRHIKNDHSKIKNFKCDACEKTFLNSFKLKCHYIRRHDKSLKCEQCGKDFTLAQNLIRHIEIFHEKKQSHRCEICKKTIKHSLIMHNRTKGHLQKLEAKDNILSSSNKSSESIVNDYKETQVEKKTACKRLTKDVNDKSKNFKCDICGQCFTRSYTFNQHIKTVHNKIREFKCETCNMKFTRAFSMKQHNSSREHARNVEKLKNTSQPASVQVFDDIQNDIKQDKTFRCDIDALHEDIEHENLPHFDVKSQNIPSSSNRAEAKNFQCDNCNKSFSNLVNLKRHRVRHNNVFIHQCEKCLKKFKTSFERKRHIKLIHDKIKDSKCDICGKSFTLPHSLKLHIKLHAENMVKLKTANRSISLKDKPKKPIKEIAKDIEEKVEITIPRQSHEHKFPKVLAISESSLIGKNLPTIPGRINGKLRCEICNKTFYSTFTKVRHFESIQKDDKPNEIDLEHKVTFDGTKDEMKTYQCNFCLMVISRITNVKEHFQNVHMGEILSYTCLDSDKTIENVKTEINTKPSETNLPKSSKSDKDDLDEVSNKTEESHEKVKKQHFKVSNKLFTKKKKSGLNKKHYKTEKEQTDPNNIDKKVGQQFTSEIKKVQGNPMENDPKTKDNENEPNVVKPNHENPEDTTIKNTKSTNDKSEEKKIHFDCNDCGQPFYGKESLKVRILKSHKDLNDCKRSTLSEMESNKSNFVVNDEKSDKDDKTNQNKVSKRRKSMEPKANYKCDLCEKDFRQAIHVMNHKRRDHDVKSSLQFTCLEKTCS